MDAYGGSLTGSRKQDYFLSDHFDLCSSAILMQLPKATVAHGPSHQQSDPRPSVEEGEASRPPECLPPAGTFMGSCSFIDILCVFLQFGLTCPTSCVQEHLGKPRGGLPTTRRASPPR